MSVNLEQDSFMDNMIVFIKGSLIFVVSQAWNSAVQYLIEKNKLNDYGKIVYAVTITIIAIYVLKIISNLKKIIDRCKFDLNEQCQKLFHFLNI